MSVERANKGEGTKQKDNEREVREDAASVVKDVSVGSSTHASEPIAQKLGIEYPFPPHLEYVLLSLLKLLFILIRPLFLQVLAEFCFLILGLVSLPLFARL